MVLAISRESSTHWIRCRVGNPARLFINLVLVVAESPRARIYEIVVAPLER